MSHENTINTESRMEICNLIQRLYGQLESIKTLIECRAELDDSVVEHLFNNLYHELGEIDKISFGGYNSELLFAAPKHAFALFKAVNNQQIAQAEREMKSERENEIQKQTKD